MIISAGRNESFSFAEAIGVGLIETAMNLTKYCLENKLEELIFIGSAGSYGEHKLFDIIESSSAANIELSFLENNSYTPLQNIIKADNSNLNETVVNSSNYISTNFELCKKYKKHGVAIENMEFFSILQVAKKFNIPVKGIFVITNYTNENAHKDFIKNHKEAMSRLTKYLKEKQIIENVSRETS